MPAFWQQLRQTRPWLLIGLMAGLLLGVQLLQASPLHEHTQHSVECTLCHLQSGDAALLQHQPPLSFGAAAGIVTNPLAATLVAATVTPYQSRAPPSSFL